jgi:putative proteasome-type protease
LSLWNAKSLFEVAGLLGDALREVRARDEAYLREKNIDASASFILGGQIGSENQRLFLVYSEGNFIESSNDTPYVQIGEIKYGKPILDRIITRRSPLSDAVKCALVSFDSTMRSNISVGAPIDMLIYEVNSLRVGMKRRLDENDAYLVAIRSGWESGLQNAFDLLPVNGWH